MRKPEKIEKRISQLEESTEDVPEEIASKIQAQIHMLEWVLDGDYGYPEGEIIGHLAHDPEIFDSVILAGMIGNRPYVGEEVERPGRYVLMRRTDV